MGTSDRFDRWRDSGYHDGARGLRLARRSGRGIEQGLESAMRGYPTMEDELRGFEEADLDEVRILVSNDEVDALSYVSHRSAADDRSRTVLQKLRSEIPRQPFEVAVGGELIALENICALSKDVTAKCQGSDITRGRKQRMKQVGKVEIP